MREPFFSKDRGRAQFRSLSLQGQMLKLVFLPSGVGDGFCLFAPIVQQGKTLYFPPFTYRFSIPMPPTYNYPLLDASLQPIIPSNHPLLVKETESILTRQKNRFESREDFRTLFWQVLFLGALGVIAFPYCHVAYTILKTQVRAYQKKKNILQRLKNYMKEHKADWSLLLRLLVFLQEKVEADRAETAQEIAVYFQKRGENQLAAAALLIERYGYLSHDHFEEFSKAYDLVSQSMEKKVTFH